MFSYALELALRGLRRSPRSTVLVVLTVALGIAACMTTVTLLHVLSADPLPGRSQYLYRAWVDTVLNQPPKVQAAMTGTINPDFSRIKLADAKVLLAAHRAVQQTVVADTADDEVSGDGRHADNDEVILMTTSAFAPMFGLRLRYGRDWTPAEDAARAPVALIDTKLARKLFGTADAVGRSVRLEKTLFRVVGVIEPIAIQPMFYTLATSSFSDDGDENMLVPLTAALDAGLEPIGTDGCDAGTKNAGIHEQTNPVHCASLGLWVKLDSPAQVAGYRTFLQNYVDQQRAALASFGKQPKARLISVSSWLMLHHVVPDNVRLNVWLGASFLVLCLLNVMGLLSARFLRRSNEIGIRRAFGAPRRSIFAQHILESTLACLAGGVLALPLTLLGLWILRQQGNSYSGLARLDPAMFGGLFALALVVGVLVGIVPAWRTTRIEPGLQVKAE